MSVIRPSTPFGYTIFCDDVRQEIAGKVTLVGMYGHEMMVFGTLPTVLPKLGLSVNYCERLGESDEPLELRIYKPGDPDEEPTFRAAIPADAREKFKDIVQASPDADEDDPIAMMTMNIALSPFEVTQEGALKVRMIRGDDEIKLGTLRIKAQPLPAGQSS